MDESIGSRWWIFFAMVAASVLLGLVVNIIPWGMLGPFEPIVDVAFLLAQATIAVGLVLFPLFLFLDTRAIRHAESSWNPNPSLYGLGGLVYPDITVFGQQVYGIIIGLLSIGYLVLRYRRVGVFRRHVSNFDRNKRFSPLTSQTNS
ncbi:hypothetical protein [Haladaptatus sp. DFWS20]|uniref:hypothetical protein n=1 Tax=Haladaptatus sp. DFWS20 TaxID=3403467 RepID=UPI003EB85ABE